MACPLVSTSNRAWYYAHQPNSDNVRATDIYELRAVEVPELKSGMYLVRLEAMVVAPMAKAFLELPGNDSGAEATGLQRLKVGQPAKGEVVAKVVESRSRRYQVGDRVWMPFHSLVELQAFWEDGRDCPPGLAPIKLPNWMKVETLCSIFSAGAGATAYVAANCTSCGRVEDPGCLSGLAACLGFSLGRRKTVLVTSAAGAVGAVACQLYKRKGCRVIGVTSCQEKAAKLLDYGCEAAVPYSFEDMHTRLAELAPEGIDVFVDNVGAAQLDVGTRHMRVGGKILSVGTMAEVNRFASGELAGWKQYHCAVGRELQFEGLNMYNRRSSFPRALLGLAWLYCRGHLKPAATCVKGNFADWARYVDGLFSGETFGRLILINEQHDATVLGA